MANFVLVHGAWGRGGYYNHIARQLRRAGHEVIIAQLTGLGARAHLAHGGIDLSTHVADVIAQIDDAEMETFILAGHSYGGMVITGVSTQIGARIEHIVYLDAFLPEDGQSLWDITGEFEHNHYINGQKNSPGLVDPLPGLGRDVALTNHPLLTLLEPVRFTGEEAKVGGRTYLFATGWEPTPFRIFYERVKDDPAWDTHTVECSHAVMADKPAEVLTLLIGIAAQ